MIMSAPESIIKLCKTFELHKDHYKSTGYNETELRREFLDPFFKALGWDVDNEQGYADAYKDVIHEDAIKVGGYTKAPDYCFRIGGTRKFFVEAKKPSVDIQKGIAPAYQLRRYGWSGKLPLSILSDFEEFAVYDTRIKPLKNDKSAKARTLYISYDQYAERWDEIESVFSREAILKGSFDKYAKTSKGKRGTGTVDVAFLSEIERWRDLLARNLALRNSALSVRDLNFAVQKTIDRLIFLRICEDRGTEDYGRLQALLNGERTYVRLQQLFQKADSRYNSGLFHFDNGEKGRGDSPDTLTPDLNIDDKVLKDILKNLYYPDSPYEFSVLPADILGQVYEQFLGKTIRLTSGHQAKIEEKPEVRKAGGVYYTPSYIVDYIVENTLGRQLDGSDPEKPKPISVSKAAELKVLDPACGSGSFLIVAYQYLLDWHLRQYTTDSEASGENASKIKRHSGGKTPEIYQVSGGSWKLTTNERKRILLNNIHGVDIDSQAVEVTKLSLLLKVLEGEKKQQLQQDFILERQRILPDLGNNIKCGNSLIGSDFYDNEQMILLDFETRYRINTFDWDKAFSEIMQCGGFDCVIGNPPYIRIQAMREWASLEVQWLKESYKSTTSGNFDIYVCFIKKAIELLGKKGAFGLIVPNKFVSTDYGKPLREYLIDSKSIESIHDFKHHQVFGATIYTLLVFGSYTGNAKHLSYSTSEASEIELEKSESKLIPFEQLATSGWDFSPLAERKLREKIMATGIPLLDLPATMSRGLSTGSDPAFLVDVNSKEAHEETSRTPVFASNFGRYSFKLNTENKLITPYEISGNEHISIPELTFSKLAPSSFQRLKNCQGILEKRKQYSAWHLFSAVRAINNCSFADIFVPLLANKGLFTILPNDSKGEVVLMASGGFAIRLLEKCELDKKYVLGVLNSKLLFWELSKTSNVFRGGWFTCTKQYFGKLPIRPIDFNNSEDVAMHDKMVMLVERMLDLNSIKLAEKNPEILRQLESQISTTDNQIDKLVYKLYDLNDEEIALVEK